MIYIDLSYAIFYRYFATYSWYSKQEDVDPKKPMKDEVFRNKYDKLFEKMLNLFSHFPFFCFLSHKKNDPPYFIPPCTVTQAQYF